ncbi:MAG: hypothetical protein FWE40_03580 [Oscillospiraceae bacterium]|jgi:hypothetical protein|nr:hypothetical protein [Oscillospiraceae bacterium]
MKTQRIKPLLFFRLSSVLQAVGYGLLTYFLIFRLIAQQDVFLTYLLNMVLIVLMLFLDSLAHRFAARKAQDVRTVYASMGNVMRAVFLLGQGFTRTGLYIFYIAALVFSRADIIRPGLLPFDLGAFFTSIEYGIILLFAFDKFRALLQKDRHWFEQTLRIDQDINKKERNT